VRREAAAWKARLGHEVFALSEINLAIEKGGSFGIIGRNGSGKSTLLRLIAGTLQPTTGQISVGAKRIAALLELGTGFEPEFTGRENVLLHGATLNLSEKENKARLDEVLAFSEIGEYFDQPVRTYSSGMIVRLAFASSITVRPELLIVDEALAVGDIFFQQRCFQKIREMVREGVTIFLVSHDLRSISEFCEQTLLLHQGKVIFFGDSNTAINKYYTLTASYRLAGPSLHRDGTANKTALSSDESDSLFEPIPGMYPADQAAVFVRFVVLDHEGNKTALFRQGEWLTVIYDIEVRTDLENVNCGIVIRDDRGVFLHSKYLFQDDVLKLRPAKAGERLRAKISIKLDISAGSYTLSFDLVSIPGSAFTHGRLSFASYDQNHERLCGTSAIFAFSVTFNTLRLGSEFSHFGLFDLPSQMSLEPID
jgi:ABC-type polysaccharide/polyol phosphate transport system ATPase subunit